MKRNIFRKKGVKKAHTGAPSGFMISVIIHAVAFFVAGIFVVFKVLPKEEPVFEPPPPIERPKMNLKKPKVKIQKSSSPKPSSRIVAKVKTAKMPEIAIPDLMGTGEGLMGGVGLGGDFLDMPQIAEVSLLGSTESTGYDLVGTYYDLKRNRRGGAKAIDKDEFIDVVNRFLKEGWRTSSLAKYYRMPHKLYMTALVVPTVPSSFGPVAFGDSDAQEGAYWLVHYKGKLVNKDGITFRFWAAGDFFCIVRLNGKIVVAGYWDTKDDGFGNKDRLIGDMWTPRGAENRKYIFGRQTLASVGDWITLEPGVPMDMEVLIGDDDAGGETGGECAFYLAVQERGVEYPLSNQGSPILPAFKTTELTHDMIDAIYPYLPEDEPICLTNGPVFSGF